MKEIYRKTRLFWHNLKNFDNPQAPTFGVDDIMVAIVEFALYDSFARPKNLFIAANSLGGSGLFYEKDGPKAMGGILGKDDKVFQQVIRNFLNEAGDLTYNMDLYKAVPRSPKLDFINFYAIGRKGRFVKNLTYNEVHCKEHPYYAFFAYSRQLVGELRKCEIERLNAAAQTSEKVKNKKPVKKIKK